VAAAMAVAARVMPKVVAAVVAKVKVVVAKAKAVVAKAKVVGARAADAARVVASPVQTRAVGTASVPAVAGQPEADADRVEVLLYDDRFGGGR